MSEIQLSVIVPIFNTAQFLPECIESIQNQTIKNFEIILVDDGSTDGSEHICDRYAKSDKRIKVIHQMSSGMQQKARNAGIEVATGQYLGFVDSDDWIAPEMFETLIGQMKDADMITSGIIRYDFSGKIIDRWIDHFAPGLYLQNEDYLYENLIISTEYDGGHVIGGIGNNIVTKVYKTSLVKEMYKATDVNVTNEEDFLFVLLYELKCKSIRVTHDCFYHYRDNTNSIIYKENYHFLEEKNRYYLTVLMALQGHRMERSLIRQFQRRFLYSLYNGVGNYFSIDEELLFPSYSYPDSKALIDKRIVLFGAGKVGCSFYRQWTMNDRIDVVLVIDNRRSQSSQSFQVHVPDEIMDTEYDIVICAVTNENVANMMKEQLIALGVNPKKIKWNKPVNIWQETFLMSEDQ